MVCLALSVFFFFNATATTEIYTLSLHDALPISPFFIVSHVPSSLSFYRDRLGFEIDRKSTRLNSSHTVISYAVFCLKKKKNTSPTRHSYPGRTALTPRLPQLAFRVTLVQVGTTY